MVIIQRQKNGLDVFSGHQPVLRNEMVDCRPSGLLAEVGKGRYQAFVIFQPVLLQKLPVGGEPGIGIGMSFRGIDIGDFFRLVLPDEMLQDQLDPMEIINGNGRCFRRIHSDANHRQIQKFFVIAEVFRLPCIIGQGDGPDDQAVDIPAGSHFIDEIGRSDLRVSHLLPFKGDEVDPVLPALGGDAVKNGGSHIVMDIDSKIAQGDLPVRPPAFRCGFRRIRLI